MTSKITIRRIGNSRGVILPATVLREVGATEELTLSVEAGRIVLEPTREVRKGWFDDAARYVPTKAEVDWEGAPLWDDAEWQW